MNKRSGKTGGVSRRLIALLLCCVCLFGAVSGSAIALKAYAVTEETVAATEPAAQTPAGENKTPAQQTKDPTEETKAPVAGAADPTEETKAPAAGVTDPTEETKAPVAGVTNPTEGDKNPTEGTTNPTEGNKTPTEETTDPTQETTDPTEETTDPTQETTEPAAGDQEEAAPADAASLYERLMACTSYKEFLEIIKSLTEDARQLLEQFTQEQKDALAARTATFADVLDTRDTASRDVTLTIEQGSSKEVKVPSKASGWGFNYTAKISGGITTDSVVTGITVQPEGSSYKVTVANDVNPGNYTLVLSYQVKYTGPFGSDQGSRNCTDTVTVTVTKPLQTGEDLAMVYYLKTPDSNPNSNATNQWGTKSPGNAIVNTDGATWEGDKNVKRPAVYNCVVDIPGMMQDGNRWLMNRDTHTEHYQIIYDAYKEKLKKELGLDNLSLEQIDKIYLVPYKISKNNDTTPDKHLDCEIIITTKRVVYTAQFQAWGDDGEYQYFDSQSCRWEDSVAKPSKTPGNVTKDGIEYTFKGWYKDEQCTESVTLPYSPDETEKEKGTIYFYAGYVPVTHSLTIRKTLSGNMYDENAKFTFTVAYGNETETITLGKDQEGTLRNIPNGATVTITEVDSKGYVASFTATSPETLKLDGTGETRTFTMPNGDVTIHCDNNKNVSVDTGILLDSMPYVVILAIVAVGAVLLVKKRHGRDD